MRTFLTLCSLLLGGVVLAAPPCVCGDSCKCAPGVCPKGCPVTYAEVYARVAAGETVTLSVGVTGPGVRLASVPGVKPGVYRCSRVAGTNTMTPLVQVRQCTGGSCSLQWVPSR